jgi:hypothetical protein
VSTEDFIIDLFCRVDDTLKGIVKHSQAKLHPGESGGLWMPGARAEGRGRITMPVKCLQVR